MNSHGSLAPLAMASDVGSFTRQRPRAARHARGILEVLLAVHHCHLGQEGYGIPPFTQWLIVHHHF